MSDKDIKGKKLNIDADILAKAWDGDAASQLLLGKAYFSAVHSEDNCSDAFKWFHRSAEQGNMEAQLRLGDLFALGQGTPTSYTDAYEWYTKAALQGYKKVWNRIYNLYQQDIKMHCRGQLDSEEDDWNDSNFQINNNIRELNEYRLEQYKSKLNHAMAYYTEQFNNLKSGDQDDSDNLLKLGFLYQNGYGTKKYIKLAINNYTEAAAQGNRDAQYHLGNLYENNTGIKFHYYLALRCYRASATNGNIAAQNALGYFYEKGLATELNLEGAFYWYTKAAKAGNSDAQLTLGKLYRKGECVKCDLSQAIIWYTLAAKQGNGAAQNCLNQLYRIGKKIQLSGIENNTGYVGKSQTKPTLRSKLQDDIDKMDSVPHINQLKKLVEHALRTDGNAMYKVGIKYYNGEDFDQDEQAGFQWIKRAAKTGLQEAEMKLADIYKNGGDAVNQDYHESSKWTRKLAKKKDNVGQCNLGLLYLSGEGVRKDPLEASKWLTKSADQGNAEAQYQFGLLKLHGIGVRKDVEEAAIWFNKSALNGNPGAMHKLGKFYEVGRVLKKNVCKALEWYEKSIELGHYASGYSVGRIYEDGEHVEKNLSKALEYYKIGNKFEVARGLGIYFRYMDGVFGVPDYALAFDILTKVVDIRLFVSNSSFSLQILTPGRCLKLMDVLIFAWKRGEENLCYDIGHLYENGISGWNSMNLDPSYYDAIHWYTEAASRGDSRAKHRLGVMYEEGEGSDANLAEAYKYYLEAHENGNADATYSLALMYMKGKGVPQDIERAYNLFTEASNTGNKQAYQYLVPSEISDNLEMLEAVAKIGYVAVQYQLGVFYQNQRNNIGKAIKWLSLASEAGITDASYRLGVIYEDQEGKNQNYSKAFSYYSKAIEKEHEDSMYRLARMYHLGKGLNQDYQKAYDLYTQAAELGHKDSANLLDITSYLAEDSFTKNNGVLVEHHSDELISILSMIEFMAEKGDVNLQCKLGTFYSTCQSHLDYNKAFKWYQMATSSGNPDAVYQLGLLYENGQGNIPDHSRSYQLYSQASAKENKDAIYRLGRAYQYGLGVPIDTTEALNHYIKAAKLGNGQSQYKLGKLHASGKLVEKDTLKALKWYTRAYLNGNRDAIKDLYQLYDDRPIESYFFERLFRIISYIENIYKSVDRPSPLRYDPIYYKLGKMYLNGQGTVINRAEALKRFLKSYYDYYCEDAKPFISLEYDPCAPAPQTTYGAKLKVYSEIQEHLPVKHQYKLGMLYYHGVRDVIINPIIPSSPVVTTVVERNYDIAKNYFYSASGKGSFEAQEQIALMYLRGHGFDMDYQEALEWFTKASQTASVAESSNRGMDFYRGQEVEKNVEIANIYLQSAVQKNYVGAQASLDEIRLSRIETELFKSNEKDRFEKEVDTIDSSSLYNRGIQLYEGLHDVAKDYSLSLFYIRKAAENDHSKAMAQLGKMYFEGKAVEKDKIQAKKWIKESLKNLDTQECCEQGLVFYNNKNYDISRTYMKMAAEENHGIAQGLLGLVYLQGYGVKKSHTEAMRWFKRSSTLLRPNMCYSNGLKFYEMLEINRNYEIALIYMEMAAKGNDYDSQIKLCIMHLNGYGVEKNYNKAMEWIRLFMEKMKEYDLHQNSLIFYDGFLVEKDYTIALLLLRKAAAKNDGLAKVQIGLMYLDGHGVPKSEFEAMRWVKKATKNLRTDICYNIGHQIYTDYESPKHLEYASVLIKHAAENNYPSAQSALGEMYLEGRGAPKNQDEALKWIRKSTIEMDPEECYELGMNYHDGIKNQKNHDVALHYLRLAYIKKYTLALTQIGIMYLEGHGVQRSQEKAMECFQQSIIETMPDECYLQGIKFYNEYRYDVSLLYIKKAAEAGNGLAQFQLGVMLLEGKAIEKNQVEALTWIEKSMDTMMPNECYSCGMELYRGTMVIKDYNISFRFIKMAAEKHHGRAQAQLGLVFHQGLGVEKDVDEALKWMKQSLKELSSDECYQQGMKFYHGTEVDQDYQIALLYIQHGAKRYHGPSQGQLALIYLEGHGVEKNHGTAMKWIEESMNELKLEECYQLGMLLYHRTGLEDNYDIALRYLNRASKGNAYAQAQLGYMYLNGIGVDKNYQEAARWYEILESNYHKDSRFCRSKIYQYDQGGMQDFSKAFKLYHEELRHVEGTLIYVNFPDKSGALRGVGLLYEYGDGVSQDFKKALGYYWRSASLKNIAAYFNMGLLYYHGKGVDQNYKEALIWLTRVATSVLDPNKSHVFIEENSDTSGSFKRAYSLQRESRIYGEAHYYIGLMYYNGYGVDQDEEKAQNYFKVAYIYYVERAKKLLF